MITCYDNDKIKFKGRDKFSATLSFNHGLSSRVSSVGSVKTREGVYRNVKSFLRGSSNLITNENVNFSLKEELAESAIGDIRGYTTADLGIVSRFSSSGKCKSAYVDKFSGYSPQFRPYEKLFPIQDISFKSKLTNSNIIVFKTENNVASITNVYSSIDDGVFTGDYVDNGKIGSLISDDSKSFIFPSFVFSSGDIQYKFRVTKPLSVAKLSYLAIRASAPFDSYAQRKPQQYKIYDIKFEDPSGNLIIQYEDMPIRGDTYYTTYLSKPLVNNLLLPTWDSKYPLMDAAGSYSITLSISYDCNTYPFTSHFTSNYEQSCIISLDANSVNPNPNPFINLNISALEIGNSGGIGILRDNYLNFYSKVRDKSEREKRTLLPTELLTHNFNNGIYPQVSSIWMSTTNETNYYNTLETGAAHLLNKIRNDIRSDYITIINSTPVSDSGRIILKFNTKPDRDAYDNYIDGAFRFGNKEFNEAKLVNYLDNDNFFDIDTLELKVIAKKAAGTSDYTIDVVGYSDDKLLSITSPIGGFIQNSGALSFDSSLVPDISGYKYKNFSFSDGALSDQSDYFKQDITPKGDHYILNSTPLINTTSFKEYTIPLQIYQDPNQLGFKNYSISSLFENLYLDICPIPSGASICSIKLVVYYKPANALMMYALGSPQNKNAIRKNTTLLPYSSGTISNGNLTQGSIVGFKSPSNLNTNYARRWRGHTGDILDSNNFDYSEFDFSFDHNQANTPFSSYVDFTKTNSNYIYDHKNTLFAQSINNINILSNFGWRYSSDQLIDGITTPYKSLSWNNNIYDNFDRALKINENIGLKSTVINTSNSFALLIKYTPDNADPLDLDNYVIMSHEDNSDWGLVLTVEGGNLKLKIKNTNNNVNTIIDSKQISEYLFPLCILITYNAEDYHTFKLYTYDNNGTRFIGNSIYNIPKVLSNPSTLFGFSQSYSDQQYIVGPVSIFMHEIGHSNTCNILENPNRFKNQISVSDLFDSYNATSDKIDNAISDWHIGDFKVCQFSSDFDFFTKRIGKDFITFNLNHSGSGYHQITNLTLPNNINLSGVSYHTQIENDFLRFNLSDVPTIDKDRFYAITPRICKTLPRGYQFNQEAICVDTIIEHETNSNILWPNGKLGPKLIVSLYTKNQEVADRPSKMFGLINKSIHYLEPSGCIRKLTSKFSFEDLLDESEPWAVFDKESYTKEFKEKYFSKDIDDMFLQYDLVFPSGNPYSSLIKLHNSNIRLDDSIYISDQTNSQFNLYTSGQQYEVSHLNLFASKNDGPIVSGINLFVSGVGPVWSKLNLFIDSSGYPCESPYLNMHTVTVGSVSAGEQTFGAMFGTSPIMGLPLSVSGQFMRETFLPLYILPKTNYSTDYMTLSVFGPGLNDGTTSDDINLYIKGSRQSIDSYPKSRMSLYVYGQEFITETNDYLYLSTLSNEINVVSNFDSLPLHTLNYPISSLLANSSATIKWNNDNIGQNITVQDNSYAYVDSDDNIRGVDLICYGTCSSNNRCSEAVIDIHGVKWYEPEVCVDGGVFRAKSTYTNLTYPSGSFRHTFASEEMNLVTENYDFVVTNNDDYISISIPSSSVFDPMPYSGHFYGIRKYTGLASNLPYRVTITGKSGSTSAIDIPTEIIEIEYNKNETNLVSTDYSGFRLLSSGTKTSGDNFGKSIASKNDLLAIGSPKRSVVYNSGVGADVTLEEAGTVFLYRRQPRPSGYNWPLDNYKSPWILETALTLPYGMLKDYYTQSEIGYLELPYNLKPIQTNWFVGQEGRQFGHSLDISINKEEKSLGEDSRQVLVVGGPSAKWTPRIFDNNPPSGVSIGLMIFTDEFTPRIPAPLPGAPFRTIGYEDVLGAIKDKDIVFNYFGNPRIKFDTRLMICQPIADSPDIVPPSFPDKPDFITLKTISRNSGYIEDTNKTSGILAGMKDAFFEAFPYDSGKIHNNIPPILGLYIDNSNSLGRDSLEPAIDQFIQFYKSYSFDNGLKDFNNIPSSGQVIEYIPEDYSAENWVEMSKLILSEVLDTGNLVTNNQIRFLTGSVGTFNTNLGAFNVPPESGGKVYIFEKESGDWNLIQEIKSPNITYSNPDRFGHAVSISDDGEVIAVGSPYINQAVTIYQKNEDERDRFYTSLIDWVKNNYPDTYSSGISAYDASYDKLSSSKSLYLSLSKDHKFKSRVDLGVEEYQNIYTFDYSNVQPIGSWSFIPNAVAPTSRLGYSVDVNEDGSVVVASAPTDSLNLYNDADIYYVNGTWKGKTFTTGYSDPSGLIPNNVKPAWSSSVNAGSVHVFESRKYYPHNKVIEYGRFGNLHEITSNDTPDSGHFHYLSNIFNDKNFVKTEFTDSKIPKEAGLAFIITPAIDALSTSDEVYNNIYNWLALGDRNLVLVANDPVWEGNGKYRNSNNILNKLLERLNSRMRIVPTRTRYESLPDGYSSFNNIIPSFVPQGSTSTYVSRSSVRGSGVADIKIYYPGYNEVMPCKEVEDCSPDPAKIQIQSRCEMPLVHYGDLRAQWNASCCTNGGMLIYGYNWPFVFGSYKPACGDQSFEDKPTANFEPIPLLVAAEKINYDVNYPVIPAQYKNFPIYETVYESNPYYTFGSPVSETPDFIWDSGNNPSGLTINLTGNTTAGRFYKPDDGILQAKGTSKIDIVPYISREIVSDKGYYCVENNYPNSSSKIIVLAGVETESTSALLSGQGDQNVKFYANLVSKTPTVKGQSNIAQLGAWTGRTSFKDGYENSYLKTLFTNNRNVVTEDVDTSFGSINRLSLNNTFNVAWVANIISQPSSNELSDLKLWLSNGNKKLIITCSNDLSSVKNAQSLCQKLGVSVEPVYLPFLDKYPQLSSSFDINQSNQAGGQFNNNKIEYFTSSISFYPLQLSSGGIGVAYDDRPIYDEVPKSNSNISWDMNAGIVKWSVPAIPCSGYRLFITTSSDTPSETAPIDIDVENATYLPRLPFPIDYSSSQINELDINGELQTYKTIEGLPKIRCEGTSTKSVDLQVSSGVSSIEIYASCAIQRVLYNSDYIPKTTKLIGISGVLIPIYESMSVVGSQIPTNRFETVKISDEQPAYTETLELIRPISTDNTKYCSSTCLSKGLGGKLIDDGPVVVAQEIEILSPFNVGVARSRITVITDSSILQGRYVADEDGVIPSETIDFIRSLYPQTDFPLTTYGRQFNKYKKLVSPERGSPSKYFGQGALSGLNVNFGNGGTVSLSNINKYESQYDPKYVTRPDVPWKDETEEKKIQEIKDQFINTFLNNQLINAASTARFSGIVDGVMYSDATIGGGLPQLLKDKGYDYLDLDKLPSGYRGDLFGYSVCVRGEKILVGSPFSAFSSETVTPWSSGLQLHLGSDGGAGSVYMFEKPSEDSWVCSKKFRPQSLMGQLSGINASSDHFGHAVALQNDTMIIGSPNHDYGNYYDVVFSSGSFARKNFSPQFDSPTYTVSDLGYSGIRSALNTNGIYGQNAGAVYVYENKITDWENKQQSWKLVEKILPSPKVPSGSITISERFGSSIYLSRPYRSDADYTIVAGCHSASGDGILNIGAAYSKDIMLRKQRPSLANSGAWIEAKVFGDKSNSDYILNLRFANIGDSVRYYADGIIVANSNGEIFIEVSGQDPSTKGFISHRPYIESVIGQYQYGKVLENGMVLYTQAQHIPPSSQMPLFIDVENSAYVYNTLGLYGSVMTDVVSTYPSGLNLFIASPSGSSASSLNLYMPSGIGSLNDNLNLQVRGK